MVSGEVVVQSPKRHALFILQLVAWPSHTLFKEAAVATARKPAVIVHANWNDGTNFKWQKEAAA